MYSRSSTVGFNSTPRAGNLWLCVIALCVVSLGCDCTHSSLRSTKSVNEEFVISEVESMPFPKESELRELWVCGPFSQWKWKVLGRAAAERALQLLRGNKPYDPEDPHGTMVNPAPPAFTLRISSDRFETYEVGFDPLGGKITFWFQDNDHGMSTVREFALRSEADKLELTSLLKD